MFPWPRSQTYQNREEGHTGLVVASSSYSRAQSCQLTRGYNMNRAAKAHSGQPVVLACPYALLAAVNEVQQLILGSQLDFALGDMHNIIREAISE